MYKKLLTLALAASFALPVLAQEASVKKAVESKLGVSVTSVSKSGYLGLYEVYFDGQIIYTDEKVSAIVAGNLIDTKTMTSVTEERMKKLNAIKFSDLPLNQAIKQVKGNGKRVLATFEDPNCGYCKRLAKDLSKLDNVTIYTFLYPILSEDSIKKSRQIWCAADKAKAWNDWMVDGKAPTGKDDCDTTAII
ncbi:MAG: DsbC family protein, partial [Azovibrio sp.]|nr:DsbC family protein [Azovibrio sp.]